jgi:hypothetical protein
MVTVNDGDGERCHRASKANGETWSPSKTYCITECPGYYWDDDAQARHCDGTLCAAALETVKQIVEYNSRMIPSPEEFLPFISAALTAVHARLEYAGQNYGEEVLFLLDEIGAVSQCFTKASRLLWSYKKQQPPEKRKDGWMDLAGYAILEMARYAYNRGLDPDDIDGLFDRSGKKK